MIFKKSSKSGRKADEKRTKSGRKADESPMDV